MRQKRLPYPRSERLGHQIQRILGPILLTGTREMLLQLVVVNEVKVTRDLSVARVYWHPLPGEAESKTKEIIDAFDRSSGYLRAQVAKELVSKRTPELRFVYDTVSESGSRIESILRDLNEQSEEE